MLCVALVFLFFIFISYALNRVPDSPKDYVCTKFGQNPLKDVDSRVFTRMLCGKNLTR
jgi:hypothetical protein